MKYTLGLSSAFVMLLCLGAPASAQEVDLKKNLIDKTLLACMPNAMGMLDFNAQNESKLNSIDIRLSDAIPLSMVSRLSMQQDPLTAVSMSAPRNILLVSSPKVHLCTVAVVDTAPMELRTALKAELQTKGAPWKLEQSEVKNGIAMDTYKWRIEGKPDILINISGPQQTIQNGKGLQLMVRVAQVQG